MPHLSQLCFLFFGRMDNIHVMREERKKQREKRGLCLARLTAGATPTSELFSAKVAFGVHPHEYGSVTSGVDSKALF